MYTIRLFVYCYIYFRITFQFKITVIMLSNLVYSFSLPCRYLCLSKQWLLFSLSKQQLQQCLRSCPVHLCPWLLQSSNWRGRSTLCYMYVLLTHSLYYIRKAIHLQHTVENLKILILFNHSACPAGTYASQNQGYCLTCPNNSFSNVSGLTQCTCVSGYYRAPTGEEDLPCVTCIFLYTQISKQDYI